MLFEEWNIGSMKIKNRLVRSGSSEAVCDPSGRPNDALSKMYRDLARGGVGLIVTGFAYIREDGRSELAQNGIHNNELIPGWRAISDTVHAAPA